MDTRYHYSEGVDTLFSAQHKLFSTSRAKNGKRIHDDSPPHPAKRTCPYSDFGRTTTGFEIKAPQPQRLITSALLIDGAFTCNSRSGTAIGIDASTFKDIPSHLPPKRAFCTTPNGTPLCVEVEELSESGERITHQLSLVLRTDAANIYSNDPELKPVTRMPTNTLCKSNPIFENEAIAKVKLAQANYKQQLLEITPKQQANIIKLNHRNQNQLMASSSGHTQQARASDYVKNFALELGKCEWLHLIGYFIAGEEKQHEGNLVAGTAHANTEMLLAIEKHIPTIRAAYPDKFTINVKAELLSHGSQIANSIHYTVITEDFEFTLTFNAQTTNKPHAVYEYYFKQIIENLINKHKNQKMADTTLTEQPEQPTTPPPVILPYFKKNPIPGAPKKNGLFTKYEGNEENIDPKQPLGTAYPARAIIF